MAGIQTADERLAQAKRVVSELRRKLANAEEKIARLVAQRAELSLAAHTGGGEAVALLADINDALVAPRLEVETLVEAIERAEILAKKAADPVHTKTEKALAEACIKRDAEAGGQPMWSAQ